MMENLIEEIKFLHDNYIVTSCPSANIRSDLYQNSEKISLMKLELRS